MRRILLAALLASGCSKKGAAERYAVIKTTRGTIVAELFADQAPLAVAHFTGLATGRMAWSHPKDHKVRLRTPLYDGLTFFRIIPGFMIQTGDPANDGSGDVGVKFKDEFSTTHRFDRPGRLGLANAGPNTNGSQFFITVAPAPDLDGRHVIFGQVVSGLEAAKAIADAPRVMTREQDRPSKPDRIESVTFRASYP